MARRSGGGGGALVAGGWGVLWKEHVKPRRPAPGFPVRSAAAPCALRALRAGKVRSGAPEEEEGEKT